MAEANNKYPEDSVFRYAIAYSILPLAASRPISDNVHPASALTLILMSGAIVFALCIIIERKATAMTTFGTLSLITVSAMYVLMGTSKSRSTILQTTIPEDCIVDLDADLVGVGIRASLYVQGIVASGILLLGLVHREDMGVKEIGASLMLSQLALATSLALRMKLGTLNHLDAIFGLISLDAQLAAVSMLLSTKQVLAARWMVILVCCCHFVGFATLGVGMGRFKYVVMVANGCEDFTIGWFGYIHPLQGPPPEYWLYFTWRIISWVRNQWVCFCVMNIYDEKERVEEYSERTDTQAMPDTQSSTAHVQTSFQHRSSTIFTDFFGPFVAFWISVDALNTNIQVMGLAATSQWKTTGQFTAILLATGSVFRVLWLTWRSATNPAAFSISHMWLDCDNIPKTPMQQPTSNVRVPRLCKFPPPRNIGIVVSIVIFLAIPTKPWWGIATTFGMTFFAILAATGFILQKLGFKSNWIRPCVIVTFWLGVGCSFFSYRFFAVHTLETGVRVSPHVPELPRTSPE